MFIMSKHNYRVRRGDFRTVRTGWGGTYRTAGNNFWGAYKGGGPGIF